MHVFPSAAPRAAAKRLDASMGVLLAGFDDTQYLYFPGHDFSEGSVMPGCRESFPRRLRRRWGSRGGGGVAGWKNIQPEFVAHPGVVGVGCRPLQIGRVLNGQNVLIKPLACSTVCVPAQWWISPRCPFGS